MENFMSLKNQLCFAVYETASEFNKLYSNALQPYGLTYPQYLVLLALWEKDGVTVKEIGEILSLGTGTLTPMLTRMEANGWIRKERSKADERRVYINLQKKAQDEKQAIIKTISNKIQSCNIELEEYTQLMERLNQLHRKLKERER
ncbi:MarR family winged helix-turn-helix transcriptional regulator [Neobacillus drentensis]|jgi:MarR family transcriptional regulator, organic hydroperoxide resistance regulator|uniref:MarR family winged helix-turn-helix transcriptional regulator n=2 Tax=Neobacillus drentensis TaxID=220684 RepID=UPI000BF3DAA9|nr:MarR family transcriptional regulator [Bacillus sp. AFS006103]